MSVPYKNPISSVQISTPLSVSRTSVFGTNFSNLNVGGYMEVYNLSDLSLTLTASSYPSLIQLSANTIPIRFTKGNGTFLSPDYLTLNSDNISSGRRRLGMLVYVHETDKVYQYVIPNYDTLWNNMSGLTGFSSVTYSDYTTVINSRSSAGQSFISGWTSSNIEGVGGYTSANANWRIFQSGSSGATVSGFYLPLSGGTVYGPTIFSSGLTANTLNVTGLTQTDGLTSTSGIIFPQLTINSTYTATTDDYLIDISGGTFNVQLPSAVGIQGRLLVVKNNGGGAVTVQPISSQTIDDKPYLILSETNSVQLASNGSNWIILGQDRSTINNSTGVFQFSGLSIASPTTFNVAPVKGWIVDDTTNPLSPQIFYVNYSGGVHTSLYVSSSTETWLYLTSGSTISQSSIELTEQQRRQNIFLGKLGHANKTSILNAFSQPDFVLSPLSQLRDMFTPINLINGGIYASANGVNLSFNTSAGYLYGLGINFASSTLTPNSIYVSGTNPCTFQYRTQTGGTASNTTFIDPINYDVGGIITPITGTKASNQRIYLVQNGQFRVQYAQHTYTTLAQAIAGLATEQFNTFTNFTNNGILIGVLSVLSTATDLSDTTKAQFFFTSKFGETVGSAGGVSTTNLQQAYNNSVPPEITTNSTLEALSIKNGTGNADNVSNLFESLNSTGNITSFIRADGLLSGSSVSTPGFTASTNGLTATTISATTYQNLPTDIRVTGGTFTAGTATFTNNTGGTFSVTGFNSSISGTTNYISKFTSSSSIGNSIIQDNGTEVGIGTAPVGGYSLSVAGNLNVSNFSYANVFVPNTAIIYDGAGNLGSRTRASGNVDYFSKGTALTHGNITFSDGNYLTSGTETARFDTYDRSLGIRTTSPTEALDVNGNIRNRGAYLDSSNSSGSTNQYLISTITGTSWTTIPTDITLTGASYSNNTFTYTNNTGGTFSVLFNTVTGLTATTISATTYQNLPSPVITGTTNYIPKFTSGTTLTNSLIYDSFSGTGINTATPIAMLDIKLSATTDYILNLKDLNNNEFFRINKAGGIFINTGATTYGAFLPTHSGIYINGDGSTSYGLNVYNQNIITFMQPYTSGAISGLQAATLNYGNVRSGLYFQNNTSSARPELFGTSIADGVLIETFRITEYGSFNIGGLNTDNSRFTIKNSRLNLGSKAFSILNSASTENIFFNDNGNANFNGGLSATTISATTITATTFVKSGGTSSQYLMADGSVSTGQTGNFWTSTGTSIYNNNSGLVLIGNTTDTTAFSSKLFVDGSIGITGSVRTSGSGGGYFFSDAASGMYSNDGSTLKFRSYNPGGNLFEFIPIYPSYTLTGGTQNVIHQGYTIGPISGGPSIRMINLEPTVVQTGSTPAIIHGIRIAPTLTSASDFRAIEVTTGRTILSNTLINGTLTATTVSATTYNGGSYTTTGTYGSVNMNASNNPGMIVVSGSGTVGGASYVDFIRVTNTSVGATNPNKTFRINNTGGIEVLNSVYTATTLTLGDDGTLFVGGGNAATTSNSDATKNYLNFNNNSSQIYDDGNMHIHSRGVGQSMWVNTNGGQINLLTQTPYAGASFGTGIAIATTSLIGYVTINTGKTYTTSANYGYLTTGGAGTYPGGSQTVNISLYCTDRIWGQEIDAFSDERMKDIEGEVSLNDAIKLVNNLKPIKYKWKEGGDTGLKVGYSAQQVSKAGFDHLISVLPKEGLEETVDEDGFVSPKDTQFSMNYDQVTPYHGVVIKHLLEQIELLKEEIRELKNK